MLFWLKQALTLIVLLVMCHGSKEDLTTRRDKTRGGSTENRKERREHREKRKKRGTQVDETDEQTNEPPPPHNTVVPTTHFVLS